MVANHFQGPESPSWYVTAGRRIENREVFLVHSDEVDEVAVLAEIFGAASHSAMSGSAAMPLSRGSRQQLGGMAISSGPSKPGAARALVMGAA